MKSKFFILALSILFSANAASNNIIQINVGRTDSSLEKQTLTLSEAKNLCSDSLAAGLTLKVRYGWVVDGLVFECPNNKSISKTLGGTGGYKSATNVLAPPMPFFERDLKVKFRVGKWDHTIGINNISLEKKRLTTGTFTLFDWATLISSYGLNPNGEERTLSLESRYDHNTLQIPSPKLMSVSTYSDYTFGVKVIKGIRMRFKGGSISFK